MVGVRRSPHREGAGTIPAARNGAAPEPEPRPASTAADGDLEALRRGDQSAFAALVRSLHPSMVRVAGTYVSSREVAEEVAQETWVAVLEGLDRFEGRSSLKTWIFRILTYQAKARGVREKRSMPFSALRVEEEEGGDPAMPPDRFFADGHRWAGHWSAPVRAWTVPEERLLSTELVGVIGEAIDGLPPAQRAVVALRDSQGLTAAEVCEVLSLSEANQRVLLHRGRVKVRAAIGAYVE